MFQRDEESGLLKVLTRLTDEFVREFSGEAATAWANYIAYQDKYLVEFEGPAGDIAEASFIECRSLRDDLNRMHCATGSRIDSFSFSDSYAIGSSRTEDGGETDLVAFFSTLELQPLDLDGQAEDLFADLDPDRSCIIDDERLPRPSVYAMVDDEVRVFDYQGTVLAEEVDPDAILDLLPEHVIDLLTNQATKAMIAMASKIGVDEDTGERQRSISGARLIFSQVKDKGRLQ